MLRFNIAIFNPYARQIYISQLKVLIQSIMNVYQNTAEIAILYHSVADNDINQIKNKFPDLLLNEFKFKKNVLTQASRKLNIWYQLLLDSDVKHQILMDSDMLLIRKIDHFFDNSFDIGYTHKTNSEEVLRKPLNTGVILINYSNEKKKRKIQSYLKYWRDKTNKIMDSKKWDGSTKGWGAIDQQVLGETLGTRNIKDMKNIIVKKGLRFKGFPCKKLNNIVHPSLDDELLCIIHYKGSWRDILPNGTWEKTKQKVRVQASK